MIDSDNAITLGGGSPVVYDYAQEKYINTKNVLSVNDGSVDGFYAAIQFLKHNNSNKMRLVIVSTEDTIAALNDFNVSLQFSWGDNQTKTISVSSATMQKYRSVRAAGETFYAENGQCCIGFVVTDIPDEVINADGTVSATILPGSADPIAIGTGSW